MLKKPIDKLSHGDVMIHDQIVAKIVHQPLPGDDGNALARWMCESMTDENFARHKKAREFLGLDWVQVFPREPVLEVSQNNDGHQVFKDVWGMVQIVSNDDRVISERPIKDESSIIKYKFPKVTDFDYDNITRWIHDGQFAVTPQLDNGFFKITQLTGFEEYMNYVYFNKSEMHTLMEKFTDFEIAMADHLIDLGADVIWLGNDFCYNSGPFMSPELLYEFDFKYMKILVDHIHKRGKPVVLHCCGNVNKTMRYMINTGVDGIHALQPTAHNDIYEMKREYGDDVCLIGNVDINQLMPHGSPYEIDQKIKEMVERLFYDRKGWILSTCNLLSIDTPIENAITMHLAAEKYGRL